MKRKIRAALGLLVLSSALVSCSNKPDADVYTIEFYTDYEGIEYASGKLDKGKAIKVGEGYVLKGKANQVARLTSLEKDEEGKAIAYEKSRQQKEGHTYTWDSWVGFYEEANLEKAETSEAVSVDDSIVGTEVVLNDIKGDCAVFAHFSDAISTYNLTIENADHTAIYSKSVDYGTKLGEALIAEYDGSKDKAKKALTLGYPFRKYYYQNYTFAGYKNGDDVYSVDELLDSDLEIKDDLKLTAYFNGPDTETYTVSFYRYPKGSANNELLSETEDVAYGNGVTKTLDNYTSGSKNYTFKGWEGTYADEAEDEVKGKPVDSKHILYDCVLYPVFDENVTVTFRTNKDSLIDEKTVSCGSSLKDILPTEIDGASLESDEIFTGLWSKVKGDVNKEGVVDPSSKAEENLVLYPVAVPKSISTTGAKGDAFTYEYSSEWGGYLLTKFEPSSSRSDKELSKVDLGLSSLPGAFEFVGIQKLGNGTSSYLSSLTKAVFPDSVKFVASSAFLGNRYLETLELPGLQKVDSFAFSQLYFLSGFTLPKTLTSIGARAFFGCTELGESGNIIVKMSEQDFEDNVEHSSEWKNIGEKDANVVFQP